MTLNGPMNPPSNFKLNHQNNRPDSRISTGWSARSSKTKTDYPAQDLAAILINGSKPIFLSTEAALAIFYHAGGTGPRILGQQTVHGGHSLRPITHFIVAVG